MRRHARKWYKTAAIATGAVVVLAGVILAPLPGPTGVPVMFVGSVIILRHSSGARRWYIVFSRRWPWLFNMIDRVLRRRRHARRRQATLAAASTARS